MKKPKVDRRRFLKGTGSCLLLPLFESFTPDRVFAQGPQKNFISFLFPNGYDNADWLPSGQGSSYSLGSTLQGLNTHRGDFSIVGGLNNMVSHINFEPNAKIEHNSAPTGFYSNVALAKVGYRAGKTIDHKIGDSLYGGDPVSCLAVGPNYSPNVYQGTTSWKSATSPVTPKKSPKEVFDYLTGKISSPATLTQKERRKSVLDTVKSQTLTLKKQLSSQDKKRLDEYYQLLREAEVKIDSQVELPFCDLGNRPGGGSVESEFRLNIDLFVLALKCGLTHVVNFFPRQENSYQVYNFLPNVGNTDHHELSHSSDNRQGSEYRQWQDITKWYVGRFKYLLDRLKAERNAQGQTLFSQSIVVFGSPLAHIHNMKDYHLLVAGGLVTRGQYLKYSDRPLANLNLTILKKMGVNASSHGNSTGTLAGL